MIGLKTLLHLTILAYVFQVPESSNVYITLFNTALNIAIPEKPFTYLEESIETQRKKGVKFLKGKESEETCREFVKYIAKVVRYFMEEILRKANFISMKMDAP